MNANLSLFSLSMLSSYWFLSFFKLSLPYLPSCIQQISQMPPKMDSKDYSMTETHQQLEQPLIKFNVDFNVVEQLDLQRGELQFHHRAVPKLLAP